MKVDYSGTVWTPSQANALDKIKSWYDGGPFFGSRELRLGGLAGTGKTHLIGYLPEFLGASVTYCAPTGRAASIINKKTGLETRTVASLLRYGPSGGEHEDDCPGGTGCKCRADGEFIKLAATDGAMWGSKQIIICDEASMIGRRQYQELLDLGARLIFCGDYGQLPPVGESNFSIMEEDRLDVVLTDITRQAEDNEIIQTAWEVRNGSGWPVGRVGDVTVLERPLRRLKVAHKPDRVVITATNKQRVKRNKEMRERLGLPPDQVVPGDIVVNLRNDHMRGVYNGERGIVTKVGPGRDEHMMFMVAEMENGSPYVGEVVRAQFNHPGNLANDQGGLFDFGYAMSCHKMQGSESPEVLLIAENIGWMPPQDRRRWRYTAVTRAKEKLIVVVPS